MTVYFEMPEGVKYTGIHRKSFDFQFVVDNPTIHQYKIMTKSIVDTLGNCYAKSINGVFYINKETNYIKRVTVQRPDWSKINSICEFDDESATLIYRFKTETEIFMAKLLMDH